MPDSHIGIVGWMDWDNRRHGGAPAHPEDARGLKVLITDANGDQHQFWNYTLVPFQSEAEWFVYVTAIATDHNIDLGDSGDDDYEPPDDGDYDDEDDDGGDYFEPPPAPSIIGRIGRAIGRIFGRGR